MTIQHPCFDELQRGVVASHIHRSGGTLRGIDNHYPTIAQFLEPFVEPRQLGCIAGSVGFEHQSAQVGNGEISIHHLFAHPGEKRQNRHVVIEQIVRTKRFLGIGTMDESFLKFDVDAGICQIMKVIRAKSVESL